MKINTHPLTHCIQQKFVVPVKYGVYFTQDLFHRDNETLKQVVLSKNEQKAVKILFVLDNGLVEKHKNLPQQIKSYCAQFPDVFQATPEPLVLPGGETCKNNEKHVTTIISEINKNGICRHSFVAAIGGGAVLDVVGYAAAIAHRGVRLIRIPTTVLSQNDSGVGVKNGINYFDKKNFIGTFSPPFAVINDINFLETLEERDWRSGIAEAIKVALIKDEAFFFFLEKASKDLKSCNLEKMKILIRRCAELHLDHIASGDAFETGSSRPLDFGHWAAHKLEHLTHYSLRHGEAVAIGIALDCTYSFLKGFFPEIHLNRVIKLLHNYGFRLFIPELRLAGGKEFAVLEGIEEFREHLGGQLTVMLLQQIGKGKEVHQIDSEIMKKSIKRLQKHEQNILYTENGEE